MLFNFDNDNSDNDASAEEALELEKWNPFDEKSFSNVRKFRNTEPKLDASDRNVATKRHFLPNPILRHPGDDPDHSQNVDRHFTFHDICADDNVAVCATVSIVIVCLCSTGLYAAIYTAYQVLEILPVYHGRITYLVSRCN